MCLCNVRKCSSFRRRVKPSFAWIVWDGTIISHKLD